MRDLASIGCRPQSGSGDALPLYSASGPVVKRDLFGRFLYITGGSKINPPVLALLPRVVRWQPPLGGTLASQAKSTGGGDRLNSSTGHADRMLPVLGDYGCRIMRSCTGERISETRETLPAPLAHQRKLLGRCWMRMVERRHAAQGASESGRHNFGIGVRRRAERDLAGGAARERSWLPPPEGSRRVGNKSPSLPANRHPIRNFCS